MGREEFHRRLAGSRRAETLPESGSLGRIVARLGHEHQPDVVGFGFVFSAVGENHAVLGRGPIGFHDHLFSLRVLRLRGVGHRLLCGLDRVALANSLAAMPCDGVRDFVGHHNGQSRFRFADRQNAFMDRYLAAGQAKGVLLRRRDQLEFPLVIGPAADRRDPLAHPLNHFDLSLVLRERFFRDRLLERGRSQGDFLVFRHQHELFAAGERSRPAARQQNDH